MNEHAFTSAFLISIGSNIFSKNAKNSFSNKYFSISRYARKLSICCSFYLLGKKLLFHNLLLISQFNFSSLLSFFHLPSTSSSFHSMPTFNSGQFKLKITTLVLWLPLGKATFRLPGKRFTQNILNKAFLSDMLHTLIFLKVSLSSLIIRGFKIRRFKNFSSAPHPASWGRFWFR